MAHRKGFSLRGREAHDKIIKDDKNRSTRPSRNKPVSKSTVDNKSKTPKMGG